ncbi:hypothetical protein [Rhodococcus sp. RD6.2]|uniref:hypothetical protein n=1 Tax=Rhodococcus sp. RD6.2 TaxID=260936 RepID=UPI000678729B|nr:hypothetical protein [Rhodococcus sp. RD6.2]
MTGGCTSGAAGGVSSAAAGVMAGGLTTTDGIAVGELVAADGVDTWVVGGGTDSGVPHAASATSNAGAASMRRLTSSSVPVYAASLGSVRGSLTAWAGQYLYQQDAPDTAEFRTARGWVSVE